MDRYDFEKALKKGAFYALGIVCPPVYVLRRQIREGIYSNWFTRTLGTTIKTGLTALACLSVGVVLNAEIRNDTTKTLNREGYETPNINLVLTQKSFCQPDSGMMGRTALFPLEGLGRLLIGKYPIGHATEFSGRVSKEGLDYSVEGTIPGIKNSRDLTLEDLREHTTNIRLNSDSYTNFFNRSQKQL